MNSLWMTLTQWYRQSRLDGSGEDVRIGRDVTFTRPWLVNLGDHIAIDKGFYCTTQLIVLDHCHIAPYITVLGGQRGMLCLQGFNTIGPHSVMVCGSDEFGGRGLVSVTIPPEYRGGVKVAPIVLEKFANVGTNVVILPGVKLGEGSVVGACSLVLNDTAPWTVYAGTPAKPLKKRPKERMIEAARKMGYR